MVSAGSKVIRAPFNVRGAVNEGDVDVAVVTSPCENVIHTLVNTAR